MSRATIAAALLFAVWVGPVAAQPVRPNVNTNPDFRGKNLDQWIKEVEDHDPSVRERAIKTIALMAENQIDVKRAAPALTRQARAPNDLSPLTNAAIALGIVLPDDPKHQKEAIMALIQLAHNDQGIIRMQAATALGNFGLPARNATNRLAEMTKDRWSWEIKRASCFALGRCGVDESGLPNMKALVALAEAVDDISKEVRVEALQGLVNLGPPVGQSDQMALKGLFEKRMAKDKDPYAQIWVRVALMRMDPSTITDKNLNFIASFLKKNDPPGINADAARALGALGGAARAKVPDLIAAVDSSDVSLVTWASWALGRMGGEAKSAIPALTRAAESSDASVKSAAQEAIKAINNPTKR